MRLLQDPTLALADIADRLGYSTNNFSRAFRTWTGGTPGSFRAKPGS